MLKHHCRKLISFFALAFLISKILLLSPHTKSMNLDTMPCASYHPQADPAERANHQVLEALRAAVTTAVQYDEWDRALPHVTFGLNNHISTETRMTSLEFVHGFTARTPLILGVTDDRPLPVDMKTSNCRQDYDHAKDMTRNVLHRHQAATDHMTAALVRLGQMLAKRVTPACIKVGDLMWMDSKHTPNDAPYKLTARWFGPFKVLEVRGAQTILDWPYFLEKITNVLICHGRNSSKQGMPNWVRLMRHQNPCWDMTA